MLLGLPTKAFNILCRENKMWVEVRKVGFIPLTLFLLSKKRSLFINAKVHSRSLNFNGNAITLFPPAFLPHPVGLGTSKTSSRYLHCHLISQHYVKWKF
jgi:hypothetical protein